MEVKGDLTAAAFIKTGGTASQVLMANGTVTTGRFFVIGQSGTTLAWPNDLNENVIASVLIPANTLGVSDNLIVEALFEVAAGTGNKIPRIRLHTSAAAAGTVYQATTIGGSGGSYSARARIAWKDVGNSQEGFGQTTAVYGTGNATITSALNINADMYIVFTGIKVSTAADVAQLRNYSVYVIGP